MFYNISVRDKYIRIFLAILFFYLGVKIHPLFMVGSIAMFITAATDSCIVYKIMGINKDLEQNNYYLSLIPKYISKPILIFSKEGKLLFRNTASTICIPSILSFDQLDCKESLETLIKSNSESTIFLVENEKTYQLLLLGKQEEKILIVSGFEITALAKTQQSLIAINKDNERLKKLYYGLIQSNHAMTQLDNEEELFSSICFNAVSIGGMKMAWVGMFDAQTLQIQPMASYGSGNEYLQDLIISGNPKDSSNECPTGKAFSENKSFWCQDFINDPLTIICHERARTFGWGGVAAVPLLCNGQVVGVFTLYSEEVEAFTSEIQNLLEEMSLDISYTLENFELKRDRERIENNLADTNSLLLSIIEHSPVRIFWKDKDLNYLGCNLVFANDAGEEDSTSVIGKTDFDLCWKDQAELYRADDRQVIESGIAKLFFEEPQTTTDGSIIWLSTSKTPLRNKENEIIGIVGLYEEITTRKNAEIELRSSQQYLKSIIDNEPECVKLVNQNGELIDMNPAGLAMLEVETLKDAQSYKLTDYVLPKWRSAFIDLLKHVMNGESGELEFEIKGLKGTRRWLETHATPLRDNEGNVTMLLGITRDTTERKNHEEQIRYLANFDALTGLPNRTQLNSRVKERLSLSARHENEVSVMFLDLDRFKDINDSLGHHIGDKLLIDVAKRLKSMLRDEDVISRLGGDEFIIILPNIQMVGASQVAQKLLDLFKTPFQLDEYELGISASIGIALFPSDGADFETLYKNADTAMYRAKQGGRNSFRFFTEEMQKYSVRTLELGNALRYALERNEFEVYYQPQFSAQSKKIIGAEALLRWTHPVLGSISPAEFIQIAEENGTILSIGEWVLRTAIAQAKRWIDQGRSPIIIAVNLSAVQFRAPNLPFLITTILDEAGLPPEYLELELTESVAMNEPLKAIAVMNNLHERGIRMSIDDFGTGYSSLSYIKKFNIYKLKIDQSFVRDINVDSEDKAIVAAIINMAKSLGLLTIAEGVETISQFDYLKEQGCDEIQGYYFSKPLPAKEFELLES